MDAGRRHLACGPSDKEDSQKESEFHERKNIRRKMRSARYWKKELYNGVSSFRLVGQA